MKQIEKDLLQPEIRRFLGSLKDCWWYHPADHLGLRFTVKKPFDFIVVYAGVTMGIEAKVSKSPSLPLIALADKDSSGKYTQLESLRTLCVAGNPISRNRNTTVGVYVVNFRVPDKKTKKGYNRCFRIGWKKIYDYIYDSDRTAESIPISWFEENGKEVFREKNSKGEYYWRLW